MFSLKKKVYEMRDHWIPYDIIAWDQDVSIVVVVRILMERKGRKK